MFESGIEHPFRTLTGTVNTCKVMVKRHIRNRQNVSSDVKDDHLEGFLETLKGKQVSF